MGKRDASLELLLQSAYRYAHALCGHIEMAEDLVHESWLKVVGKHGANPDKALLFRVIRNLFIDGVRHNTRFPKDSFEDSPMIDEASFDPSHYASHDMVLAQGLATLRSVEREALFLWVFEGHTAAEIASLTDQSRGTVLSQIHRSKAKLKKVLEQQASQGLIVIDAKERDLS